MKAFKCACYVVACKRRWPRKWIHFLWNTPSRQCCAVKFFLQSCGGPFFPKTLSLIHFSCLHSRLVMDTPRTVSAGVTGRLLFIKHKYLLRVWVWSGFYEMMSNISLLQLALHVPAVRTVCRRYNSHYGSLQRNRDVHWSSHEKNLPYQLSQQDISTVLPNANHDVQSTCDKYLSCFCCYFPHFDDISRPLHWWCSTDCEM